MTTHTDRRYADALAAHKTGNLDAAAQLCGEILQSTPEHADTMHLFGIIAGQTGNWQAAT